MFRHKSTGLAPKQATALGSDRLCCGSLAKPLVSIPPKHVVLTRRACCPWELVLAILQRPAWASTSVTRKQSQNAGENRGEPPKKASKMHEICGTSLLYVPTSGLVSIYLIVHLLPLLHLSCSLYMLVYFLVFTLMTRPR